MIERTPIYYTKRCMTGEEGGDGGNYSLQPFIFPTYAL